MVIDDDLTLDQSYLLALLEPQLGPVTNLALSKVDGGFAWRALDARGRSFSGTLIVRMRAVSGEIEAWVEATPDGAS